MAEVEIPEDYTIERSWGYGWSPDGSRLALYLRNNDPEEVHDVIGVLDLDQFTLSVFETPSISEILGWTQDGQAVIIRSHTDKGNILKEVPIIR